MESVKKWLSDRTAKKNGLYVHYSPPKLVGVVTAAQLRLWARGGAESRLERAVLAGQGRRLLAEAEALPLASHLPRLVAKCQALHAALERGSLHELQELVGEDYNRRKYITCLDEAGVGLLHKAIFYDYMDIAEWLVKNYPQLVHQKDAEGRTALHYVGMCRDEAAAAALLEGAGAARGARDAAGRTPAFYRGAARTLLALPASPDMPPNKNPTGLVIKRHNIRIWCHDSDMARLQRVVWEGHGTKLLMEVSNQPVVKRFLEAVPYIMNTIRDIHGVVIKNDLEGLMKLAGDPVPPQILSSRDSHNMTVLHKAAGLGHGGIMNYIVDRYPQGINDIDNDGRTPLHYAAAVRDEQHVFNTLISLGADQGAVDNKNRTPGYYINRPQDIDKNLLKMLPEAPRTASSAYPPNWDWKLLDSDNIVEVNKKPRRKNMKASNENISSKNNTNTVSDSTEYRGGAMKGSNTHEYIKGLPELDDSRNGIHKETEIVDDHENTVDNAKQEENDETPNAEVAEKDDDTTEHEETNESVEVAEKESKESHENPKTETDDTDTHDVPPTGNETEEETEEHEEEHKDEDVKINEIQGDNDLIDDKKLEEPIAIENKVVNDEEPECDAKEHVQAHEQAQNEADSDIPERTIEQTIHDDKEEIDNENNMTTETNSKEVNDSSDEKLADQKPNTDEKTDHPNPHDRQGSAASTKEGNNSSEHTEDDDDVQVQGDTNSEYCDLNHKITIDKSHSGSAKRGNVNDGRNTQESLIEGIIRGEAEQDSQDASITQRDGSVHEKVLVVDNEIDPEVTELINTANMEMLATLVLNGEGSRLIGRRSGNSDLQAFLDNVPTYMQKINKVHAAAKDGNIKELQSALDRRKFAIARDPTSANGATPLHVATIYGKTNIIKYLGGRFPETLSAVDFEGRTALHYAAVLPDNGHYYNLLQQLGANAKDLDDGGKSADDYYKNPQLLPFNQLITDFGITEEESREMFSDKGPANADNGQMDIPMFHTEEGRYLAKSLGDPLIKGLTEVANAKPKDPVAFLASFLHNFPETKEKAQLGTEESKLIVTQGAGEVENEAQPLGAALVAAPLVAAAPPRAEPVGSQARERTAPRPRPIDVVTVDPQPVTSPDAPEIAFSSVNRDEHGQSMLHFAAARTHARNALFQLLQESDVSLAYRDELYRTARDVSIQANVPENTAEIDKWVLHLAARGNTEKIMELILEGYDHILDVTDEESVPITDVISQRGNSEMSDLLASIPAFEESRETLHAAVRRGELSSVTDMLVDGGRPLARSQNTFGRTALHVAVLAQHEDIVAHLAQTYPELLRVGDNLERTPLHYAMGVDKIESLSRILIRAGAKRVLKDLKGRQPSYYFMNKSEILRLKEEEDVY